jgi:hypothetical protein
MVSCFGPMEVVVVRSALLAVLALGAFAGAAAAGEVPGRRSIPYREARETFRRLGYKPYFMPGADVCDPDDPRCFPELEYCAKSRTWACTYTWQRGRSIIEVETRYDNPVVARSDCVINCSKSNESPAAGTLRFEGDPGQVD